MSAERPSTPPAAREPGVLPRSPLTPEQIRKIEINRLKAKAQRQQKEAEAAQNGTATSNLAAGQKRAYSAISTSTVPSTSRDARNEASTNGTDPKRPLDSIQPARNFQQKKYIEYDFSKMTDTKGGFMTAEDDPFNKALHAKEDDGRPPHMTMKEWERHKLLQQLREQRAGPFEPSIEERQRENKRCVECRTLEIDYKWEEVFGIAVCSACKDKFPEKYSLLTKTEAKDDYMLTDAELKDEELLPHLEKPNPHKSSWNSMMLFMRCQVEEYAIKQKWGSEEALDAAYEAREKEKKRRKSEKFKNKLQELKKRTRVEAWKRANKGENGGNFGDVVGRSGKHEHEWGRPEVDDDTGVSVKKCIECGMEVEELEF